MRLQREMVLDLETLEAHSSLSKWFDALKHRVNTTHCHLSPLEPWDKRKNGDGSRFLGILQAWERARSAKKKESKKRLTPKAAVWKEICIRVKKIPRIDNSWDTIFCNNWIEPVCYFVTCWCAVHSQDLRGCNRALTVHLFIKSSLFQAWVKVYHHSVSALPVFFSLLFLFLTTCWGLLALALKVFLNHCYFYFHERKVLSPSRNILVMHSPCLQIFYVCACACICEFFKTCLETCQTKSYQS